MSATAEDIPVDETFEEEGIWTWARHRFETEHLRGRAVGREEGRAEGRADARAELLALAASLAEPAVCDELAQIEDLTDLRIALGEVLRAARSADG